MQVNRFFHWLFLSVMCLSCHAGHAADDGVDVALDFGAAFNALCISEINVVPSAKHSRTTWLELTNWSDQPINLRGYSLRNGRGLVLTINVPVTIDPNESLLIEFHATEDEDGLPFTLVPKTTKVIAFHSAIPFPPTATIAEHFDTIPIDSKYGLKRRIGPADDIEAEIVAMAVLFGLARNRYAGEIALYDERDELVAYASWGSSKFNNIELFPQYSLAASRGLVFDGTPDPMVSRSGNDRPGGILHILPGYCYQWLPEEAASPGFIPTFRIPLLVPAEADLSPFLLSVVCEGAYAVPRLRQLSGWSRLFLNLTYDSHGTQPLFPVEHIEVSFHGNDFRIPLSPAAHYYLADRTLYAQTFRVHKDGNFMYGKVVAIKVPLPPFDSATLADRGREVRVLSPEMNEVDQLRDITHAVEQIARTETSGYEMRLLRDPIRMEVRAKQREFSSVEFLRSLPVSALDVDRTEVTDLSPLHDAPLVELDVSYTAVHDLSVLRAANFQVLNVRRSNVASLDGLATSALRILDISETSISDISSLANAPLEIFVCAGSKVADFSPLSGSKLTILDISGHRNWPVLDLASIATIHSLRKLNLSVMSERWG